MILNKLSDRAATIFKSLPESKKTYSIQKIVDLITKSKGLGTKILQSIDINYNNRKTVNVEQLLKESYLQASQLDHPFVGTEHILLALLTIVKSSDYNKVLDEINKYSVFSKNIDALGTNPLVTQYTKDLTMHYIKNYNDKKYNVVYVDTYKQLVTSLVSKTSSGVILVGEHGVGRESLINLLALKTSTLDVPVSLIEHKIIQIDFLNFMLSNINKTGIEVGISTLLEELKSYGKVIVVLKNLENLFLPSSAGVSIPIAFSLFKNVLKENDIKIVAKMSTDIFEKISTDNESALENFNIIEVSEPNNDDTFKIVRNYCNQLEKHHNVLINDSIIEFAIKKSDTALAELSNPKKTIVLLDLACSLVNINKNHVDKKYQELINTSINKIKHINSNLEKRNYEGANDIRVELLKIEQDIDTIENKKTAKAKPFELTKKDINHLIENYFYKKVKKSNKDLVKLSKLNKKILQNIVGQDDAVNKTVKALIRSSLGLKSSKRPMGNFLFLGPTGVGKTELAKVLAKSFFGENSLIRLDMSDFGEKHNVARLVGAPPGYIGYGDGGELTSKIASNPNSVVLFDEIEKAHPDVLNILLQILDEGELKDSKGNTFKFNKSVIILTSNAGTNIVHNTNIGFTTNDIEHSELTKRLKSNLKKIMKPELLNRFDEVIIFKQLEREDQYHILDLLIKDITQNLQKQKVTLKVTKKVKDYILDKGYSKEFGVRALRRVLETELLDKVADYLLKNYKKPLEIKASIKKDKISIH